MWSWKIWLANITFVAGFSFGLAPVSFYMRMFMWCKPTNLLNYRVGCFSHLSYSFFLWNMDMEWWKHEMEVPMHAIEEDDDVNGTILSIILSNCIRTLKKETWWKEGTKVHKDDHQMLHTLCASTWPHL